MLLNLRQAIYKRMQAKDQEGLFATIHDAIDHDERALPGLGVLFEIIWKHSDEKSQATMVELIQQHLPEQK
jgi:small acid-soluble spore protein I (minor)